MNEASLVEIETKLAFQDDTLQQLNDVICRQQQQIDRLETICEYLLNRVKELPQPDITVTSIDETPPHY